jgi:hypothetical protein
MMRRFQMHVAAVAAGAVLLWGGNHLAAAEAASAVLPRSAAAEPAPIVASAPISPAMSNPIGTGGLAPIGVEYGMDFSTGSVNPGHVLGSGDAVTATAGEGVAAIPLPPSAYPGMVGLATAALSVWRYRRRRR